MTGAFDANDPSGLDVPAANGKSVWKRPDSVAKRLESSPNVPSRGRRILGSGSIVIFHVVLIAHNTVYSNDLKYMCSFEFVANCCHSVRGFVAAATRYALRNICGSLTALVQGNCCIPLRTIGKRGRPQVATGPTWRSYDPTAFTTPLVFVVASCAMGTASAMLMYFEPNAAGSAGVGHVDRIESFHRLPS